MTNGEHGGAEPRRGTLRDVMGPMEPPAALEERVVRALRDRGVLAPRRPHRRPQRLARLAWGAAASAALAASLLLGAALGARRERARAAPATAAADAPRFALLLYADPARPEPVGPAHDAIVAEYRAWARGLAARGHAVSGEELDDAAWPVTPAPAPGDGPPLVGFFVVSARSAEEARAIARSCPHAARGGAVVVRPIRPT